MDDVRAQSCKGNYCGLLLRREGKVPTGLRTLGHGDWDANRFRQSEIQHLDLADLNVVPNRRRQNRLLVRPYVVSLPSTIYQVVGGIVQIWLRRESISKPSDRLQ